MPVRLGLLSVADKFDPTRAVERRTDGVFEVYVVDGDLVEADNTDPTSMNRVEISNNTGQEVEIRVYEGADVIQELTLPQAATESFPLVQRWTRIEIGDPPADLRL
ncbi:MAG: hypothetical protein JSV80_00090 [Acidobacteriota bacterium]|nr:MAG: hypothetical protein JSV80_00090 [Acidobacteriota bacterium]